MTLWRAVRWDDVRVEVVRGVGCGGRSRRRAQGHIGGRHGLCGGACLFRGRRCVDSQHDGQGAWPTGRRMLNVTYILLAR